MSLENFTFSYYHEVKFLLKQYSFKVICKVYPSLLSVPISPYYEVSTKNKTIVKDLLENLTCAQNHELKFLQKYRRVDDVTCKIDLLLLSTAMLQLFPSGSGPATSKMELFVKIVNGFQPITVFTKSFNYAETWYLDPLLVLVKSFENSTALKIRGWNLVQSHDLN